MSRRLYLCPFVQTASFSAGRHPRAGSDFREPFGSISALIISTVVLSLGGHVPPAHLYQSEADGNAWDRHVSLESGQGGVSPPNHTA